MQRFNGVLLVFFCTFLTICCTQKIVVTPSPILDYSKINSDSSLVAEFLKYKNQLSRIDSSFVTYYEARVFYPKDSTFKVINLYGETEGGATYNSFVESHIFQNNKIQESSIEGETFKIDRENDSTYLFYTDNSWRLGSHLYVYEVCFLKDSVQINETENHGNYVYDLMNNRKESPEKFPKNIHELFPKPDPKYQPTDSTSNTFNGNYYPDELFMERNGPNFFTQLFYRRQFGDQIEKVVQITHNDTTREITLAMIGGDSDSYKLSSEFVNDTLFIATLVNGETIKDDNERMAYGYDSIIKKYNYTNHLELQLIAQDTFKFEKEYFNRYTKRVEKQTFYSQPFKINNLNCCWVTEFEIDYDGKKQSLKGKRIHRKVINTNTKKTMLISEDDVIVSDKMNYFEPNPDLFFDFNFDGYLDCSMYNHFKSGASNSFYDNFLFNPKTQQFEYSEELSGAEITIDEKQRTVNFFYKSGLNNHLEKTFFYDKKAKLLYTESIKTEDYYDKKSKKWHIKKTYVTTKNGKIVAKTIREE